MDNKQFIVTVKHTELDQFLNHTFEHTYNYNIAIEDKDCGDFYDAMQSVGEKDAYKRVANVKALKKHLEDWFVDMGDKIQVVEIKEVDSFD